MRIARLALVAAVLALVACEPADSGGGGGGVGGKLAFIRSGMLVVSLDSGDQERDLTDQNTSTDPALSRNGQTVAFAYAEGGDLGTTTIETVPFSGSTRTPVASPAAGQSFSQPAWSPDGSTLVFLDTEGATTTLMTVPSAGGTPAALSPAPQTSENLAFPTYIDQQTLLVSVGTSLELETLNLTSGVLTDLGVSSPSRAAVSPDGSKIAYAKSGTTLHIVLRDLNSGTETPLAQTDSDDLNPAFAPDGTLVAFDTKGQNASSPQIYDVKADGSAGTMLLQSGQEVSWGP